MSVFRVNYGRPVAMHSEPRRGSSYDSKVRPGTVVEALDRTNFNNGIEWHWVQVCNKRQKGWVKGGYLEPVLASNSRCNIEISTGGRSGGRERRYS